MPELLSKPKTAKHMGLSTKAVDKLINEGILPFRIVPPSRVMFTLADIEEALERMRRRKPCPTEKKARRTGSTISRSKTAPETIIDFGALYRQRQKAKQLRSRKRSGVNT